jgi:hypothetical protein
MLTVTGVPCKKLLRRSPRRPDYLPDNRHSRTRWRDRRETSLAWSTPIASWRWPDNLLVESPHFRLWAWSRCYKLCRCRKWHVCGIAGESEPGPVRGPCQVIPVCARAHVVVELTRGNLQQPGSVGIHEPHVYSAPRACRTEGDLVAKRRPRGAEIIFEIPGEVDAPLLVRTLSPAPSEFTTDQSNCSA